MIPTIPLIEIAIGLVAIGAGCIWLAVLNGRARRADPRAWIDTRITAERDPGRRAAWRIIRDQDKAA